MDLDMMEPESDESTYWTTPPLIRLHKPVEPRRYTPMFICVEGMQSSARFGIKKGENIIGRSLTCDVALQDDMASRRHARVVYKNGDQPDQPPECFVEDLGSRNGTELNGELVTSPKRLNERDRILVGGTLLGFFLRDEKEMENEQLLYEMATRDALTGLDNRYQFRTHMRLYVERAKRYGHTVSLAIIDADHFKAVNDRHGHDVGDKVLLHLARLIEACCRSTEICARWGGEEFVVLMPDADHAAAFALAERIRATVESTPLRQPANPIYLTVSGGVAELGLSDDMDSLFRNADQNLLKAKQCGRNRVC
jgi:two-component system, cell cycle response regulator